MSCPRTPVNWVKASERLPDLETYGPYPRVLVATSHHAHPEWGFGLQFAELRFINGDKSRPTWVSVHKRDNLQPVETTAFGVTHWADPPADPEPIAATAGTPGQ